MAALNETPVANRIHIAFFGLRNAGKSTLVNAFCNQDVAIVSDTPGTTTDPVSKAMEILPLGPCLITDTAGLDDTGALGEKRVEKTLAVLATCDIAVWVWGDGGENPSAPDAHFHELFLEACRKRDVKVVTYRRGNSVAELKKTIAALGAACEKLPGLLDGLVGKDDRVVCVCPIDAAAPKGRLILPQVQVIRTCLDLHIGCTVCQPEELADCLQALQGTSSQRRTLVITDSQAFSSVSATLERFRQAGKAEVALTSFSILFARQKGNLAVFRQGIAAIGRLKDGDTVLIAEGCTHHRQCNDIGSVKIPKALAKLSGKTLNCVFASGNDFSLTPLPSLVVHCGGCMLTRREVLRRMDQAQSAGVPIVNYGLLLAAAQGVDVLSNITRLS